MMSDKYKKIFLKICILSFILFLSYSNIFIKETLAVSSDLRQLIQESTEAAQKAAKIANLPEFEPGAVITSFGIELTAKGKQILIGSSQVIVESTEAAQKAAKIANLPEFEPGAVITSSGIELTAKGKEILNRNIQKMHELAQIDLIAEIAETTEEIEDLKEEIAVNNEDQGFAGVEDISDFIQTANTENEDVSDELKEDNDKEGFFSKFKSIAASFLSFPEKISDWLDYVFLLLIILLVVLIFRQKKKKEQK